MILKEAWYRETALDRNLQQIIAEVARYYEKEESIPQDLLDRFKVLAIRTGMRLSEAIQLFPSDIPVALALPKEKVASLIVARVDQKMGEWDTNLSDPGYSLERLYFEREVYLNGTQEWVYYLPYEGETAPAISDITLEAHGIYTDIEDLEGRYEDYDRYWDALEGNLQSAVPDAEQEMLTSLEAIFDLEDLSVEETEYAQNSNEDWGVKVIVSINYSPGIEPFPDEELTVLAGDDFL